MKLEKARHKHSRERRKTGVIALPQADIFCPTVVGKQVRLPRQVLWVLKYSTIDWVIFCFFKSTRENSRPWEEERLSDVERFATQRACSNHYWPGGDGLQG